MILKQELVQYPSKVPAKNAYIFTANSIVTSEGLVMGGGNALAFRETYPNSPKVFGMLIQGCLNEQRKPTKFLHASVQGDGVVMAMIVKQHFRDPSPIEYVEKAVAELTTHALKYPDWTFHLPMPAVGLGGLTLEKVSPIIGELPDNVIVYYKKV